MSSPKMHPDKQTMDPVLWTAFGVCLVCIVLLGVAFSNTTTSNQSNSRAEDVNSDPTRFSPLTIDATRLMQKRREQQREAQLGAVNEELAHLHAVVRKANLAQFPKQDGQPSVDPIMLTAEVTFAADEILPATGVRGFTAAGEPIFAACNEGIEELLKAVRLKNISLQDAQHNPSPSRFQKYRENCGNALTMLLKHGLITPNAQWAKPYAPTLFDILNRYRWAHIAHARLPARLQLAPYEYELLMRWRIEDPDAFTFAERRKFITQASSELHNYDALLAEVLLRNEGIDRAEAVEHLRELSEKHPDNQDYRRRYQRSLKFAE